MPAPGLATFGYIHAFDRRFAAHGVGLVLLDHAVRHAVDEGCSEFNFLRGAEPYKQRFGAQELRLASFEVVPRRSAAAVEARARAGLRGAWRRLPGSAGGGCGGCSAARDLRRAVIWRDDGRGMDRVLFFSVTAMLNPTLLAATTVMLLLPSPRKLMVGYLLGAMLTSVTLGLVIVFTLQDSAVVDSGQHTVNPVVDLAAGGLLLVVAAVLGTGHDEGLRQRRRQRAAERPDKGPPRWQRELGKGSARITFVVGMVLTLPGASYIAALDAISHLKYSTAATVALVLVANVIMLALVEVAILGFYLAPEWTTRTLDRAKAWFRRNAHRIATTGTGTLGALLVARGVITLLA